MNGVESILGNDFKAGSPTTESFLIHGLILNVTSNSSILLDPIINLLSYFHSPEATRDPDIHFHLLQYPLLQFQPLTSIREEGHLLFDSEKDDELYLSRDMGINLKYLLWKELYIADFGPTGVLLLDLFKGKGIGVFPDPTSVHPRIMANFIFLIGFSELLHSRDLFLIHAAALAKEGKGILIPGFTRNGKTTLSVALLRGGFKFLSDDRPFLRRKNEGFELLAFPEGLDVTDQTIAFFPEFKHLGNDIFKSGLKKKEFFVERVYPNSILNRCHPQVLLFPNIVEKEVSQLRPLSKIEAVTKLLPHSLLVFDPTIAERHFHLLCQLVEEMDCYHLDFGKDLLSVHQLIEKVLS